MILSSRFATSFAACFATKPTAQYLITFLDTKASWLKLAISSQSLRRVCPTQLGIHISKPLAGYQMRTVEGYYQEFHTSIGQQAAIAETFKTLPSYIRDLGQRLLNFVANTYTNLLQYHNDSPSSLSHPFAVSQAEDTGTRLCHGRKRP